MKKKYWVKIEVLSGPKINGYDIWICEWADLCNEMICPLESIKAGDPFDVRLTIMEMTDTECAQYCIDNEIENEW